MIVPDAIPKINFPIRIAQMFKNSVGTMLRQASKLIKMMAFLLPSARILPAVNDPIMRPEIAALEIAVFHFFAWMSCSHPN